MSTRGIAPTESKVEAVVNAREPESVAEIRSFRGLVNFSAKFILNLATAAEPLQQPTRKGVTSNGVRGKKKHSWFSRKH